MTGNLGISINPNELDTESAGSSGGYSLLQDGPTEFVVEELEIVDSKTHDGYQNVAAIYASVDPENPGTMREWIVISNPSEKAEVMGQTKLAALGVSAGVSEAISDTDQIQGKHVFLDVVTRERGDKPGQFGNQVGRYIPRVEWEAERPVRTAPVAAAAGSPAPQANAPQSNKPWAKGNQ